MDLHAKIMNLPERNDAERAGMDFYSVGHKDALHAAAALALEQQAELEALRKDAERYNKLVASGKYCAAHIGGGWGLLTGWAGTSNKAELDAAADALPAIDAAMKG